MSRVFSFFAFDRDLPRQQIPFSVVMPMGFGDSCNAAEGWTLGRYSRLFLIVSSLDTLSFYLDPALRGISRREDKVSVSFICV